jgi:ABC-type xylose transport system substrate-binding protein
MKLEYAGALSDPAAALLFSGYNHGVDHLIVDGKFVVKGGRLTGANEERIRDEANHCAKRLLTKAGIQAAW